MVLNALKMFEAHFKRQIALRIIFLSNFAWQGKSQSSEISVKSLGKKDDMESRQFYKIEKAYTTVSINRKVLKNDSFKY